MPHAFVSGNADHFALRVAGDSMIGAGILDGDLVVIRSQATAQDGDRSWPRCSPDRPRTKPR